MDDKISELFLNFASEKRRGILHEIKNGNYGITKMAASLDSTPPEIHRNVERLLKHGIIEKDSEKEFVLSPLGQTMMYQISALEFFAKNSKYFKKHGFADLLPKFLLRIGQLSSCKEINGFVKVQQEWNEIYKNAQKYVHNILYEVPYSDEIVKTVVSQADRGIKFKSVFSDNAIIPDERKKIIESKAVKRIISSGNVERRNNPNVRLILIMNEHEACVSFPFHDSDADVSSCLVSKDEDFVDWCKDYFAFVWNNSVPFREERLQKL